MTEWLKIWQIEEEQAKQEQTDRLNKRYQSSQFTLEGANQTSIVRSFFPSTSSPSYSHIHFSYDFSNRMTNDEEQASAEEGEEQIDEEKELEQRQGN